MAIPFSCPHCGKQTNVDDRYAGQTGPCSHCGQAITIPQRVGPAPAHMDTAPRGGTSWIVVLAIIFGGGFALLMIIGILVALLLPALQVARSAARKAQSTNNLKQISLALLNYEVTYGTLPPAYIADENGKPMHSWRVLILPFMEQKALYDQYRFDEPWDGPNNSRLHDVIMPTFVDPSSMDDDMTYTNYVAVVGEGTMFPGAEAVSTRDITNPSGPVILVVSLAGSDIKWCEPRDLEYDSMSFRVQDPEYESISSDGPGDVPVSLSDGSVRRLDESLDESALQSMLLRE